MEDEEKRPKKKSFIRSHDDTGAASSPTEGRGNTYVGLLTTAVVAP